MGSFWIPVSPLRHVCSYLFSNPRFDPLFVRLLACKMASVASAEPHLGPLQDPKSELPPTRNASFCFGCVFSCALVLATLEVLLGLLLARFWVPKRAPDRPRSRPRSVSNKRPKNNSKIVPKWDPKPAVKIENFWQKTGYRFHGWSWPGSPWEAPWLLLGPGASF